MSNINVRLSGVRIRKTEDAGYVAGGYLIEPEKEPNLPLGVTQVEYFELLAPKLFAFDFKGADLPRIQKLLNEHDLNHASHVVPLKAKISVEEYRLIVPETLLSIFSKREQDKAQMFLPPVQMQYLPPVLYRFIKGCYAKDLMEEGKIRISSFERCRKCEGGCGDRFDQGEGKGVFSIQAGDCTAEFMLQVGGNPLMFCMALSPDARKGKDDVCIEIFDLPLLINAISVGLTEAGIKIQRVLHAPCSYAERLFVRKCVKSGHALEKLVGQMVSGTKGFDFHLCGEMPLIEIGDRHYFTKPISFSDEHEYRIVWDCDSVPEDGKVDIVIKDVQTFCRLYEKPCLSKNKRDTQSPKGCTEKTRRNVHCGRKAKK